MNSAICVYYSDGKPVKNKKVEISISGLLSGGSAHAFTDNSGCANISHASKGTAKVFINGNHVATLNVPGRMKITI